MLQSYSFLKGLRAAAFGPLLCVLLAGVPLAAQPTLVKDINPGSLSNLEQSAAYSFRPEHLVNLNGVAYFSAFDPVNGRELWKSDGTPAGTVLVKDISLGRQDSDPAGLVVVNNTLYFSAGDGSGRELWKSDGTSAGTVKVKDIAPGAAGSGPFDLVGMGSTLYFVADDGVSGNELWKSNGTAAGTVRVKDILPGAGSAFAEGAYGAQDLPYLTPVNGTLYFVADNGVNGFELWKSNGTAAGTVLVSDQFPGEYTDYYGAHPNSSSPRYLTNVNGTLFFSAYHSEIGRELYKSDGTAAGTGTVKDIEPGYANYAQEFISSDPSDLTGINGILYFSAGSGLDGRELWRSDGTYEGTVMVKDLAPGTYTETHPYRPWIQWEEPYNGNPLELTNVNGTLYFTGGSGLWKSNGTEAGTVMINGFASAQNLTNINGTLFFSYNSGLYKSNGTAAGTVLVKDMGPNSAFNFNGGLPYFTNVNGTLFFAALSGTNGYQLWKSNGTSAGTIVLKGIPAAAPASSTPQYLTDVNGTLYFSVNTNPGGLAAYELWKSNGTTAGTVAVKGIGPSIGQFLNVNGTLYFVADNGTNGNELWKSDGTAAGTVLVKDINPGGDGLPYPGRMAVVNGTLYFVAGDGTSGMELWKTDGTAAGTVRVKDINPGATGSEPYWLTAVNGTLYFSAEAAPGDRELWKSNGTAAGTVRVKDINPGAGGSDVTGLTNLNGTLYFNGNNGSGYSLWKSTGTDAGTVQVKAVPARMLTKVNNTLFFWGGPGTNGIELWKSDGTAAGTVLVKKIATGLYESYPAFLRAANGILYFTTQHAVYGQEIWRSDGTATGTFLTKDTAPGASGISIEYTAVAGNALYVATGYAGSAIWQSNGTTAGTGKVTDMYAYDLAGMNGVLYFAGANSATGIELWKYDPAACTTPLASLSLQGSAVSLNSPATVTVKAAQAGVRYQLYYGGSTVGTAQAGTGSDLSFTIPATSLSVGTYIFSVNAIGCVETLLTQTATVTVSAATADRRFRVNAGGNGFSTVDARAFAADAYFSGGVVSTATSLGIGATADDYLYQTGRHGTSFAYHFPTGNGSFDVVLHFSETYWGNTGPGGAGSRRFHVDMEGARKLTNYDIFAKAGGALRATQETFRVNVSDGTLNVNFLRGLADNPAVKAIEVLPAGSALAVNAGGSAFTATNGKAFASDVYYADGRVSTPSTADIANTTDDVLYRTGRFGPSFSYGLPSGNGTFDVILHFSENYWGSRATGGVGSRRFNVYVEGVKRLSDYDIFAKAGGALRAVKETVRVTVTDGVLNLYFAKGSADNALVSAVEVVAVTTTARVAADEQSPEDWQVRLYPNPVGDKLTVSLPFAAGQVSGTAVTDATGKVRLPDAHKAVGENELEIRTDGLPGGLYLLRLDTDNGSRLLKFVKR